MRGIIGRRLGGSGTTQYGVRLIQPGALAGGGIVTFSRAQVGSISTALSSGGGGNWWTEYAADVPRFGGSANRLMLGGQRTTMNTRQRLIGGTGWTLSNVTAATTTGPDGGGATANQLDEGAATAAHAVNHSNISATLGVTYSMSAIVKAETCTTCQLVFTSGAFGANAWQNFDLAGAVLGTGGAGVINPRIVLLGSGWYWISASATATATATSQPVSICMTNSASASRAVSYTGTNRTMLAFWGWAEDAAAFPSSAILATSEPNAATRGQDTLTSSFATLFPSGVGTVLGSFVLPFNAPAASSFLVEINNGTSAERIAVWISNADGVSARLSRAVGGVLVNAPTMGTMTAGTLFRVGFTFDGTTVTGNFNGGTNQTIAGQPVGLTTLRVGNNSTGTAPTFGECGYLDTLPYVIPGANLPAAVAAIPA